MKYLYKGQIVTANSKEEAKTKVVSMPSKNKKLLSKSKEDYEKLVKELNKTPLKFKHDKKQAFSSSVLDINRDTSIEIEVCYVASTILVSSFLDMEEYGLYVRNTECNSVNECVKELNKILLKIKDFKDSTDSLIKEYKAIKSKIGKAKDKLIDFFNI